MKDFCTTLVEKLKALGIENDEELEGLIEEFETLMRKNSLRSNYPWLWQKEG